MKNWVKQNQRINYAICSIVLLYGTLIFICQQSLWFFFFKEGTSGTLKASTLCTFLTNGCAIFSFCYAGLSFVVAKISNNAINRQLLFVNIILWFCWVIFDWYFIFDYSRLFQILNIIFSHGIFLSLVTILFNMLREEYKS